jgi:hypothetical protein
MYKCCVSFDGHYVTIIIGFHLLIDFEGFFFINVQGFANWAIFSYIAHFVKFK